ncbi:MAG: helix-turn-helix domain-containing protein [Anaerolineales bacterium]|nr:helix-turn-helix domain-containing protein [Anaerolineales bacterium]MDW8161319.1 substrate-binding domain-containing protein [Anaerolineales bacterium]
METAQLLRSFPQIEALADPQRLAILQHLMAKPATLTQLAARLGHSPAWVRHHLKRLEAVGLVKFHESRKRGRQTERYYCAVAGAFFIQERVLPKCEKPILVFSGSDDLAWEVLAGHLERFYHILSLPVGSLNGLVYLRQGFSQVAGSHLFDEWSGEYNLPTIRHLFPDHPTLVITLVHRTQGLILAPGNPKAIRSLADLARPDVRLINRNRGSGTRLWLDRQLRHLGLSPAQLQGYDSEVCTHLDCALAVRDCRADVALGIEAAAYKTGLDFIPLFQERYDLTVFSEMQSMYAPLFDLLASRNFRQAVQTLPGYDATESGKCFYI